MPGTLPRGREKHVSHEHASADMRQADELKPFDSGMHSLPFVRSSEAYLGAVGKEWPRAVTLNRFLGAPARLLHHGLRLSSPTTSRRCRSSLVEPRE